MRVHQQEFQDLIQITGGGTSRDGDRSASIPYLPVTKILKSDLLRPHSHLADAVAVLAGDGEGFADAIEGTGVGEQWGERCGVRFEECQGFFGFVIGAADVEDGELLAAHGGTVHGDVGRGMNAGDEDAAGIAGELDGLARGVFAGGAVDGAIDAAASGFVEDGVDGFGRLDGDIGAHGAGEFAAVRERLDHPDAAGVDGAESGDGEQTNRAGADDGSGFAGTDGRQMERVQGNGERLGQGGLVEGHGRGDGKEIGDGQVDEFAEEAGVAGVAEEADIGADVVVAGAAEFAVIAVESGLERAAVAGSEAGDAGAGFDDVAGGLVAEDHGVDVGRAADGALGVGVEIGAAYADGLDADLDFSGCGVFDGHIDEAEGVGGDEFGGAHTLTPSNDSASAGGGERPTVECAGVHSRCVDMFCTCKYACSMAVMIQVRNVPESLHRSLKARAAMAGMSLSDYLLVELREIAARPTLAEFRERLHTRTPVTVALETGRLVREERAAR